MKFIETPLNSAYIIELEKKEDNRGFFARSFCIEEFKNNRLNYNIVQINTSFSKFAGTLRGMHYQVAPYQEDKIVRCIKGSIYDVIIDLRPDSSTYLKWFGIELNEENRLALYVPKGFAHGNISLVDNTELFYLVTEFYHPEAERGIRWDDPLFSIKWPIQPKFISNKDKSYPDYELVKEIK